jgi:hypothetical protein
VRLLIGLKSEYEMGIKEAANWRNDEWTEWMMFIAKVEMSFELMADNYRWMEDDVVIITWKSILQCFVVQII